MSGRDFSIRPRSVCLAALVLALLPACRTRMLDEPVGPPVDFAVEPGPIDIADPPLPDLATPDLAPPPCLTHVRVPVTLDEILPVQLPGARIGTTLLVSIAYHLRTGCDVPADVTQSVILGRGSRVDLTAHLFRANVPDAECATITTVRRTLVIDDAVNLNQREVTVQDASPMGTKSITVTLGSRVATNCASLRAEGAACDGDCQCFGTSPDLRCVRFADAVFRCAQPCSEDVDCRFRGLPGQARRCDPVKRLCVACTPPDCGCSGDRDCPFGQQCAAGYCTPRGGVKGVACRCDPECPTETLCVEGSCRAACSTLNDCGQSAVACSDGICR